MHDRLLKPPAILIFTNPAFDVVGVGFANALIRGYVNLPLELDNAVVYHLRLVE